MLSFMNTCSFSTCAFTVPKIATDKKKNTSIGIDDTITVSLTVINVEKIRNDYFENY